MRLLPRFSHLNGGTGEAWNRASRDLDHVSLKIARISAHIMTSLRHVALSRNIYVHVTVSNLFWLLHLRFLCFWLKKANLNYV